MTKQQQLIESVCNLWDCFPQDLGPMTFREVLEDADRMAGVTVGWAYWSEAELGETVSLYLP